MKSSQIIYAPTAFVGSQLSAYGLVINMGDWIHFAVPYIVMGLWGLFRPFRDVFFSSKKPFLILVVVTSNFGIVPKLYELLLMNDIDIGVSKGGVMLLVLTVAFVAVKLIYTRRKLESFGWEVLDD